MSALLAPNAKYIFLIVFLPPCFSLPCCAFPDWKLFESERVPEPCQSDRLFYPAAPSRTHFSPAALVITNASRLRPLALVLWRSAEARETARSMWGRKKAPEPSAPPPPPAPAPSGAAAARELRRENDRTARSAARAMDGELRRLRMEETKMKSEMKMLARQGKMAEAKMLAKNLAQNQKFQQKCFSSKYQVSSIANQGNMALTQQKVNEAMGDTVGLMAKANARADVAGAMSIAQQYEMEASKAEMQGEMMDDALEGAFGGEEVDAETENILNEVLAEAGMEVGSKVHAAGATPSSLPAHAARDEAARQQESDDIERRLAALGGPPTGY